jgi:predicted GIY-YIG superfamily endonuclease
LKLIYWEVVETREDALVKEKEWKSASGRRRLKRIIENLVNKNIKE